MVGGSNPSKPAMSLDLSLVGEERETTCDCATCGNTHTRTKRDVFYDTNITHNLGKMFYEAGVYEILWQGNGLVAGEQIEKLEAALRLMEQEPSRFEALSAPNGWGTYKHAVPWLRDVIRAFKEHPNATLHCYV